jgi:hypothetical protein
LFALVRFAAGFFAAVPVRARAVERAPFARTDLPADPVRAVDAGGGGDDRAASGIASAGP